MQELGVLLQGFPRKKCTRLHLAKEVAFKMGPSGASRSTTRAAGRRDDSCGGGGLAAVAFFVPRTKAALTRMSTAGSKKIRMCFMGATSAGHCRRFGVGTRQDVEVR